MPRRPRSALSRAPAARETHPRGLGGEAQAIEVIRRVLGARGAPDPQGWVGIGDDAAVLAPGGRTLVFTVDAQVEDVHFRLDWLSPTDVGWRSYQAAVSDLAAMGARPVAALSSVVIPPHFRELEALVRGQAAASRALNCPLVGGNIARGRELSITTTCLGRVARPLLRSGARPGDALWLLGDVGLARAGLKSFELGIEGGGRALRACRTAWSRPRALLDEGAVLARGARSALDVSDGLSRDAGHLAKESGVRVVVEEVALRACLRPELYALAPKLGEDALALALEGGEDYALLASGVGRPPRGARCIGRVERGRGVWLEGHNGRLRALTGGYDHLG